MEFTEEELKEILWEDSEHELVYEGEWQDQGKFQQSEAVFRHKDNGNYYMFGVVRYGNHWSGYELEFWDTDVWEVELKEVVVKEWVSK